MQVNHFRENMSGVNWADSDPYNSTDFSLIANQSIISVHESRNCIEDVVLATCTTTS